MSDLERKYWLTAFTRACRRMAFGVLALGLTACDGTVESPTPTGPNIAGSREQAAVCTKLNLNTATGDDLATAIPNLNGVSTTEFLAARPYASIQQFRRQLGRVLDANKVLSLEYYVYVPVDLNESDTATMMQLPGVDQTVAELLIQERPYPSEEVFFAELDKYVSDEELERAGCYLSGQQNQPV